jgi:predicted oxidoreductase
MLYRGIPENIRSDNGPEFVAEEVRKWLAKVGMCWFSLKWRDDVFR